MNERIRELYSQAAEYVSKQEPKDGIAAELERAQKFAELIVRECAELADESTSRPYESYGEKIRKHFGVEE